LAAFAVNIVSEPEIMVIDETWRWVHELSGQVHHRAHAIYRSGRDGYSSATISALKTVLAGDLSRHGIVKSLAKRGRPEHTSGRARRNECGNSRFVRMPRSCGETWQWRRGNSYQEYNGALKRSDEFDKRVAAFRYSSEGKNYVCRTARHG
jgi:hypothetical protein